MAAKKAGTTMNADTARPIAESLCQSISQCARYSPDHPVSKGLMSRSAELILAAVQAHGELDITVERRALYWEGEKLPIRDLRSAKIPAQLQGMGLAMLTIEESAEKRSIERFIQLCVVDKEEIAERGGLAKVVKEEGLPGVIAFDSIANAPVGSEPDVTSPLRDTQPIAATKLKKKSTWPTQGPAAQEAGTQTQVLVLKLTDRIRAHIPDFEGIDPDVFVYYLGQRFRTEIKNLVRSHNNHRLRQLQQSYNYMTVLEEVIATTDLGFAVTDSAGNIVMLSNGGYEPEFQNGVPFSEAFLATMEGYQKGAVVDYNAIRVIDLVKDRKGRIAAVLFMAKE